MTEPDPFAPPDPPARRKPNCSVSEARYQEAMQWFLNGMPDREIAQRLGVSPATVAAQRFKRGVMRALRPEPPRGPELEMELPEPAPLPARPDLRPAQRPPPGDWRTWLFLGGRGAGKTLAGASWLAGRACEVGRLALVGPTYADVREVMIEGPSGLRGLGAAFGPKGGPPATSPRAGGWCGPTGRSGTCSPPRSRTACAAPSSTPPGPTSSAPGRAPPTPWPTCAWAFAWEAIRD